MNLATISATKIQQKYRIGSTHTAFAKQPFKIKIKKILVQCSIGKMQCKIPFTGGAPFYT